MVIAQAHFIDQTGYMATRSFPVEDLTPDERIELIGRLWDSLDADTAAPMTDALRQELASREREADRDSGSGESWEALRDRLTKPTG